MRARVGPPALATVRGAAVLVLAAVVAGCATTGDAVIPVESLQPSSMAATGNETDTARRARIRLELGASYYQQGNYNVALEEARQSVAIAPDYAPAHGLLGLIYMSLGERARAEQSFERALRLAPADSELNNNFGWFLCQTGREKRALEHFSTALKNPLYTTPARPLHNSGICALRLGDETGAEKFFLSAFQVDPRDAVAMYNLSELYLKRSDLARARFYARRLLESYEPSAEVLWLAFRVERAGGDREAAASHALQLRRRFPKSPETALLLSGKWGG